MFEVNSGKCEAVGPGACVRVLKSLWGACPLPLDGARGCGPLVLPSGP